jgi:predicted Co/Zn/Cd cation transporter (cation efflux family)
MNDIQTITRYFTIVYGLVAVAVAAYALWLARAARRARARLAAAPK